LPVTGTRPITRASVTRHRMSVVCAGLLIQAAIT
jgi:hypothetical protein